MEYIKRRVQEPVVQVYLIVWLFFFLFCLFLVTTPDVNSYYTAASAASVIVLTLGPLFWHFVSKSNVWALFLTVAQLFPWMFLMREWDSGTNWVTGSILVSLMIGVFSAFIIWFTDLVNPTVN